MITQLTHEQEVQLEVYAEKWRKIAFSTESTNRYEAERGIRWVYKHVGLEIPKEIIWCDSPQIVYQLALEKRNIEQISMSAYGSRTYSINSCYESIRSLASVNLSFLINSNTASKVDRYLRDNLGELMQNSFVAPTRQTVGLNIPYHVVGFNPYTSAWLHARYDYYENIFGFHDLFAKHKGLEHLATHAGWWVPFKEVCFVSDRHLVLKLDANHRPHCEDGYAIVYPDGWGIYIWHGMYVPDYVIEQPNLITPRGILRVGNVDMAKILIERYGMERFIKDAELVAVQSDNYGELYRFELEQIHFRQSNEAITIIKAKNIDTNHEHFQYVPSYIRTAQAGAEWDRKHNKQP